MTRAIVLGAGMVGTVMAADLAADADFEVALADLRPDALDRARRKAGPKLNTIQVDLSDQQSLRRTVEGFDIVLGALSSTLGFATLKTVIEAGRNYCDISFMPEDAWTLGAMAEKSGVTAVVDCGVAPGMSNLLAGYGANQLDSCDRIEILVGGLPRERHWPFQYKAGFSPHDVIEEYTRPSRIVEHGRIVFREALSEPELIDFPGIGTLESFNTDGLRSLAHFLKAPFMRERTLRYPGHIELMRVFRETGLFDHEPIEVRGVSVRPIDVLATLMFPKWTYQPGEEDLTVMRVMVEGVRGDRRHRLTWDLFDRFDKVSGDTSMSRTTAFPCAIMARLIARGVYRRPGVMTPELVAESPGITQTMLTELEQRNVRFTFRDQVID